MKANKNARNSPQVTPSVSKSSGYQEVTAIRRKRIESGGLNENGHSATHNCVRTGFNGDNWTKLQNYGLQKCCRLFYGFSQKN